MRKSKTETHNHSDLHFWKCNEIYFSDVIKDAGLGYGRDCGGQIPAGAFPYSLVTDTLSSSVSPRKELKNSSIHRFGSII